MFEDLPKRFETFSFSAFFKIWYHFQKDIPEKTRQSALIRVGRGLAKEINFTGIDSVEDLFEALKGFLENEWAITDSVSFKK
ncbi:MAG: hypothetical protein ACTSWN_15330 [Promethearchaeota archaeon]